MTAKVECWSRPSGTLLATEDVETKDFGSVESKGKGQVVEQDDETYSSSHPGEGILIINSYSKIREVDLGNLGISTSSLSRWKSEPLRLMKGLSG